MMEEKYSLADIIVVLFMLMIGAAEAAHLLGVFFHRSFSLCMTVFCVLSILLAVLLLILALPRVRRASATAFSPQEWALLAVLMLLVLSQIFFVAAGERGYIQGDITAETAGSFLRTNAVYQVNPATGRAYEAGMPTRIEVLCLPTLYAALSGILRMEPGMFVFHVMPAVTLICCYCAYACLAESLFPGDRRRRLYFLAVVGLLIWVGSYSFGADGFGLLFSGWRGVTLRNAVLVPYTVSLCLRKKFIWAAICVLAELCIVWTLYGMGVCLLVTAGLALTELLRTKQRAGREAADD